MNIEELELSLRTEFEGQVRNVLAGIKQDVMEFQTKFQAELEEHRNKLDQAIGELSTRLPESSPFDAAFTESVNEHLRLARDDGAQVAATAFGEAEKLRTETEPAATPASGFDLIRDAIADISSKGTQATILQALVSHASRFAARGAFFILKNDKFVLWKLFGSDVGDEASSDILFASSADTLLSASVRSLAIVSAGQGTYAEDGGLLDALKFGRPAEMHAIPLTARGRGVAVLYADAGDGGNLNVEALETLVRVAGITVELLAASQTVAAPPPEADRTVTHEATVEETVHETTDAAEYEAPAEYEAASVEEEVDVVEEVEVSVEAATVESIESAVEPAQAESEAVEVEAEYTGEVTYELEQTASAYDVPVVEAPEVETFQPVAEVETVAETEPEAEPVSDYAFSSSESYDASYEAAEEPAVSHDVPVIEAPVAVSLNGNGNVATVAEPQVQVTAAEPKKSRFSDRNVDLPIEVADDERKLHNDARRFARLLVSEIKLYNEQKVTDGRESGNLYEQLKEAIDRSREMYDKRVQPAVASKFDYFHYEVVNSLADGKDANLGSGYPGATV